jgi:hypothetical protein
LTAQSHAYCQIGANEAFAYASFAATDGDYINL